ncbi:MAG: hypothetical protein JNM25_06945 [Planctomycetes bacterium]|nr:hypothetical protein [Planctomycetota bacterium]
MMRDPDDFGARRRAAAAANPPAPDPDHAAPSPQLIETERMLRQQRAGDNTFSARRILCLIRSDRRPFDVETLTAAVDDIATAESLSAAAVRDLLDAALQLEGSSFEAWKDDLAKRRPRIGRGTKPAQQLLQAVQSILFLLTLVGLCSAEALSAAASTSTAAVVAVRCGPRTAVSWAASRGAARSGAADPSARPPVRTSFAARSGGHCLPRRTGRASGEHGGRRGAARSGAAARIPSGALCIFVGTDHFSRPSRIRPRMGIGGAAAGGFLPSRDVRSMRARAFTTTNGTEVTATWA